MFKLLNIHNGILGERKGLHFASVRGCFCLFFVFVFLFEEMNCIEIAGDNCWHVLSVSMHAGIDFSWYPIWLTSCQTCSVKAYWEPWKFPPMGCQHLHIYRLHYGILSLTFSPVFRRCKCTQFDTMTFSLR